MGKMTEMNCAELVKEAAKIIYMVHDEVKDKMFELELSWVGEFTGGLHKRVPDNVHEEAEKFAKSAMEEDSDDSVKALDEAAAKLDAAEAKPQRKLSAKSSPRKSP